MVSEVGLTATGCCAKFPCHFTNSMVVYCLFVGKFCLICQLFTNKVMDSNSNGQIWCRIPRKRDGKASSRLSLSPWFFPLFLLFLINNTDVHGFSISRTVRNQYGHHVFSQSRVGGSRLSMGGDLESLVAQAVTQGPYLLVTDNHHLISVDTRVRWTCDNIVAIDGRENYQGLSQQWTETTMKDLAESRYSSSQSHFRHLSFFLSCSYLICPI